MDDGELDDFKARFKIVCRKCGGENVTLDVEEGTDYGGETGYSPGTLSFGCPDCKANDWFASI
jgi:hypothetical protein